MSALLRRRSNAHPNPASPRALGRYTKADGRSRSLLRVDHGGWKIEPVDQLLFWIGLAFIVTGLGFSVRAIYVVTANRGLNAAWVRGLRRARAFGSQVMHAVVGGPSTQTVRPDGIPSGSAVGAVTFTGSATGGAGPVTVEDRVRALEDDLARLRDSVAVKTDELASSVESVRAEFGARTSAIEQRIADAEEEAAKIDAVAVNSEMVGVVFIAVGTLIQAIATLV